MGRLLEALKGMWQRSMMHRALMVAPPVALILLGAYASVGQRGGAQYFTAKVDQGDISQVVQTTGTINPYNTVPVGSVVSGNIVAINVDFNSKVKKDDILAQIDPTPFQAALAQAEASYQNATANVANLEAQIGTSRANVDTMKANIVKAHATTIDMGTQQKRTKLLADQGVLSAQQNDDAQAAYDESVASENAAAAQEKQAEAQLAATIAQRDQAKAQLAMQKASVDSAKLELSYCTIRAPIDGTIINRTVTLGQPVAASLQAPNLFSVGQDLTHMLVYTNTDEADVGRIRNGAAATFRVDAYPRETFNGVVDQQRMNPATIQNVVTYNTTIAFDNPDLRLFPGMTAYASIPVATAKDVVKIPNGALRFKPDLSDNQRKALYAKYNRTDCRRRDNPLGSKRFECRGWSWRNRRSWEGPGRRRRRRTASGRRWRPGRWRRCQSPASWQRRWREHPTGGYRYRVEAPSGQVSRAGSSAPRRDRLHVYGDVEWNPEARR
jgi:HlyD family secretion protein